VESGELRNFDIKKIFITLIIYSKFKKVLSSQLSVLNSQLLIEI